MLECMHVCLQVYHVYSHVTTVHIFNITEEIWLPHCEYDKMAVRLHGHIYPTFLHMCAKTQPTTIPTSHVIAMYGPATNMPLKCHIYANCFMFTWHNYVSRNTSHQFTAIKNRTRNTGIHFTLLAYTPEQICIDTAHIYPTALLL